MRSSTIHALRGMISLAELTADFPNTGGYFLMEDIVKGSGLRYPYMAKIMQDLARHGGLVRSSKGRLGGFRLARPADEITAMEIVEAVGDTDGLDLLPSVVQSLRETTLLEITTQYQEMSHA